jgi:hypothetical protein
MSVKSDDLMFILQTKATNSRTVGNYEYCFKFADDGFMLEIWLLVPLPCMSSYPEMSWVMLLKHFHQLQIIVKSGDDCRQEHLAVQLVAHFYGKSL